MRWRPLLRKVQKSLARRGVLGSLLYVGQYTKERANRLFEYGMRAAEHSKASNDFDQKHHVETQTFVELTELNIASPNWVFGFNYQAVSADVFAAIMKGLALDFSRFQFIDLGAGKGRALLLASEHPFKKITGVEFAPQLVERAKRNLLSYRSPTQRCRNIELVCMDAAHYPIPAEPIVFFLYNPFDEPVMSAVVRHVRESLVERPRDIVVLYYNPRLSQLWQDVPELHRITVAKDYEIFRSRR